MVKFIIFILMSFLYAFAGENPYLISAKEAKENFKDYIFIFADSKENYQKEHIPNSINIDAFYLQDIAIQNKEKERCKYLPLCPQTAQKLFSENGISNKSKVIIYYTNPEKPYTATYVWFVLYSMGMPETNLKILDGGLNAWKNAGYETTSTFYNPSKADFKPNPRYNVVATKEEVLKYVKERPEDTVLLDVRSFLEHVGKQPIQEIKRVGHIPGAKFIYWKFFQGKDSFFKPKEKILKTLDELKITKDKKIIISCSIGVRSSFVFLALKSIGFNNLKIYTGGWYEWGNDESLPIWEP